MNSRRYLAGAAIVLATGAAATQAQEVVVRIGHAGPLSGPIAHIGKDNENGARMAIEELNAAKPVIGGRNVRFELMSEDDGADPRLGTAAAQKLADAKVNGVIGHVTSGTTIPAAKIYSDAGIPQISPSATNPRYTQQGYKTAFRLVANDAQLGSVLGRYAVDTVKAKRIAVIDDRTAYGQGVADEFVKAVRAKGGSEIVTREFTNDKATDFNAILTAVKSKKPDLIFYGGMDAVGGPMLRQMKSLGIGAKFMGGDGVCTESMLQLAGDAIGEGLVTCAEAGGIEDKHKTKVDAFRTAYRKRYGSDVQLYAPYAYDAVMVMVESMRKAGSTDPAKYLGQLATLEYDGLTGRIAFDPKGDVRNGTLTLYTFKEKKRVQLGITR
ncbi:branched-chain amino acid ABC transporter substrate-binding protein [Noviherbaspirillum sp.]|uniref:branched-chain amino acid ABC transporter substrate-binding protein n=1 Tax=Noviherbaspirillum sp. TaxID=1926288 RepID=UPI002D2F9762|nr:branched-chain amino acid ABC transporter substrate-binding protein [Noviherbaspirillum sp.]HZW19965.1 branched-chain amino acid ABC transporter substrate-binding protein [Noviherbaspirillum sp.]